MADFNFYILILYQFFLNFIFIILYAITRSSKQYLYVLYKFKAYLKVILGSVAIGSFVYSHLGSYLFYLFSDYVDLVQISYFCSLIVFKPKYFFSIFFLLFIQIVIFSHNSCLDITKDSNLLALKGNLIVLISGTTTSYQTNCAQPESSNFLTLVSTSDKRFFNSYLLPPNCFKYCLKREFLCCFYFSLFKRFCSYLLFSSIIFYLNLRSCFRFFQKLFNTLQGSLFFQPYWQFVSAFNTLWMPYCINSISFLKFNIKGSYSPYIFFQGSAII